MKLQDEVVPLAVGFVLTTWIADRLLALPADSWAYGVREDSFLKVLALVCRRPVLTGDFSAAGFSLPPPLEIARRRKNQNTAEPASEMRAEMLLIAGEQVRGPGVEGRLEYRLIFLRQLNAWRQRSNRSDHADLFKKFCQPEALILFGEVEPGFLCGVSGGH